MKFDVRPMHPLFGAEVVDMPRLRELSDEQVASLIGAACEYGVLVLRNQPLDDEDQLHFTRRIGPVERSNAKSNLVSRRPDVIVVTNVDANTNEIMQSRDERMTYRDANFIWHSDGSFKHRPVTFSLLSARETPPAGADTEFIDMRGAYERLSADEQARLESLKVVHDIRHTRADFFKAGEENTMPPVRHPVVLQHPENGRKALYLGAHAARIEGLPERESRELIDRLVAQAAGPGMIYAHKWKPHDLVIWDNRSVLHRATPFRSTEHRRVLHRTMVTGQREGEFA